MEPSNERIIEDALSLPADMRLNLIEKLLTSLNLPADKDVERLWADEVERRFTEIKNNKVRLVPGEEVFAKIRAKYTK